MKRDCEKCGTEMPANTPRQRVAGLFVCESCTSHKKVAHDMSMRDPLIVRHCSFCFSGETEYMTIDGSKTFADTVGTTQMVLSAPENEREAGRWVPAHIHSFGVQKLLRVDLSRNGVKKSVYATPEHRWLVKWGKGRATNKDVLTKDLRADYRLSHVVLPGVEDLEPSWEGIRHGLVFGDGYATRKYAGITLWGDKDKQLIKYFEDRPQSPRVTPNGIHGVRIQSRLHSWMKLAPDMDASDEYLYGWLTGYFAADGSVSKQGQVVLSSANMEHLELVKAVANRLGITTYGITTTMRKGFNDYETPLHKLEFLGSSLRDSFFLVEEQRERHSLKNYKYERLGWMVMGVYETDREEEVFCAVVPEYASFALEDNLWVGNCGSGQVVARNDGSVECGFCQSVFTVRVEPFYMGWPQTVNGVPQDIPLHPNESGDNAGGFPGEEIPGGTQDQFGAGFDEEDEDLEEDEGFEENEEEDEDEDDFDFSRQSHLNTAFGGHVDEESYIKHLAIRLANDKDIDRIINAVRMVQ